jgi:hypothetical protein
METLLIVTILVGAALYILNMLPIDATFKRIAWVVILVLWVIYIIRFMFGTGNLNL